MKINLCIIDMNNGLENQAIKSFRKIVDEFSIWLLEQNRKLKIYSQEISIRNQDVDNIPDADIYLSTGGPGSPWDGKNLSWEKKYFELLDCIKNNSNKSILGICHSFQLMSRWSGRGDVRLRPQGKKFGIMPVYVTTEGEKSSLFKNFSDRLFAFEHRDWEVVNYHGPGILARESRDGVSKGEAILGMEFESNIHGVQFHPEAESEGILFWLSKPDKKQEIIDVYGEELFESMIKNLNREDRVIHTRNLFIPQWLRDQYFKILNR